MKTTFLRKSFLFLVFLLGGIGVQQAHADHISSVDMHVDYIGTGPTDMKYKVVIDLYRICISNNLQLGTSYGTTVVYSQALGFSKYINPVNVLFKDAKGNMVYEDTTDNLCPAFSSINSCRVLSNTSFSGYTHRRYEDTLTVPGRSSDLTFAWNACCRLLSYTNINGGTSSSFWIQAGINNLAKYNNSTPRYNGQPFTFVCANQKSTMSNIPYDPDGDSLITYSIVPDATPFISTPPWNTVHTNANYNSGYTPAFPTGTSGSYAVAPRSGKATFVATASGKFVLAFRTEDWDKTTHQQLGYVSRDLTISVLPCTNQPPPIDSLPISLTGIKGVDTTGGEVVINVCPQQRLNFQVNSVSNNPGGVLVLRSASTLPVGMTVTPNYAAGGGSAYVDINWTPTAADIGTHVITILAIDSTCTVGQEITLRSDFTFTIIVRPGLDAGPDLTACPLGDKPVKLGTNGSPTANYTWKGLDGQPGRFLTCTDCPNPYSGPTQDYTYVVHTDEPIFACKSEDTVTVFIDKSNSIELPQDILVFCRPGYDTLKAIPHGPAPLANLACGVNNPITCSVANQDTSTVGNGTNPAFLSANTPFYSGATYHKYQYIIPKSELLNAGLYSGTLNGIGFLHINPTLVGGAPLENISISLGCVYADDLPSPGTNASFFVNGLTQVANVSSYAITPNSWNYINFTTPYSWDTTLNLLVDVCMGPMTTPNAAGGDPVAMMPGHVIQRYDNNVNVCGGDAPTVQDYLQRPVTRFIYCPSPELPFHLTWSPGTYLNDSTQYTPRAFISDSINYVVTTVGRNGCRVANTLHIVVPHHHLSLTPQDSVICRQQPAFLTATGGTGYHWYEYTGGVFNSASGSLSCTTCQSPIAFPQQTTTYAVVFDNEINEGSSFNPNYAVGCPDTLFTTVNVKALPPVRSMNKDTTIGYGKSVQLFARGASNYTWTPVGSLSDPNSPAPVATPKETTTYIVTGLDSNGCAARDTVKVTVVFTDHLLIPTAFTPNGDGRNDYFKVVNPTYQKLMEFRVFNRWGQEVFSTTDMNEGWDGTWKGVPQEVGTYQYLIRTGSPDGQVERYRGDVTLVR